MELVHTRIECDCRLNNCILSSSNMSIVLVICYCKLIIIIIIVIQKADRSALEGKASREWVDSTFERLDREIREAKSHLLGQEEALRNAVGQLNEDVEGKMDRMELEPLKDYFGKTSTNVLAIITLYMD